MVPRPFVSRSLVLAVGLASACGGRSTHTSEPARASEAPASPSPTPGGESASPSDAGVHATDAGDPRILSVSGHAGDPNVIDVSGQSDLPANVPSTAQPFLRVIDAAVAPTRPALAECVHAMGNAAPRFYRVTVELDGHLTPRAPQPVALSPSIAACLEGIVQGTTVNPPPPMTLPYDIYFRTP